MLEEEKVEEPRVANFDELFKWFGYMHQACAGPDWQYKPETHIKHTVFQYKAPVIEMLKKQNIIIPQ